MKSDNGLKVFVLRYSNIQMSLIKIRQVIYLILYLKMKLIILLNNANTITLNYRIKMQST
jgi:hypothetical protein